MYGGNNGGGAPPQWPSRKPAAKKAAPALRITNISSGATELRMPAAPPKKPAAKKPAARRQASPPPAPPPPRQIENPHKIAKWTGTCENTRIQFPFEPYDCQLDFMSKTLEAVATKQTALLESPTGTGKTLCLLTATLAYSLPRSSELEKPTVVYASRTHAQLSQAVKALRATVYQPKVAVVGSREHLCGHPRVSKLRGTAQNRACSALCARRACHLRNELDRQQKASRNADQNGQALDIEELVADGARRGTCAYYGARHSLKEADLIFAPYNYVLDERHRNTSGVNWRGSIIILDEAHNVASVAEDAASFSLTSVDLAGALQELDRAVSAAPRQELASNVDGGEGLQIGEDELLSLKRIILGLEDALMNTKHLEDKGGMLHEKVLTPSGLTCAAAGAWFADACKRAGDVVQADARGTGNAAPKLELLERACTLAFRGDAHCKALADDHYRIRIATDQDEVRLDYWCFSPALALQDLRSLGVSSVLCASGTLSPLPSFAGELGLQTYVSLQNPHVVDAEKDLLCAVVGTGPSNVSLKSTYSERRTIGYKQELGLTICQAAEQLDRGGLLVFFPSYPALNDCVEHWRGSSLWSRLERGRAVVVEPRKAKDMRTIAVQFQRAASTTCAVLLAVCRGKASEGMDFSDDQCRVVIVTGVPYAPPDDPRVKAKRRFLDDKRRTGDKKLLLSGDAWYEQQACRAVNQAVGRCVRHAKDWGAVLLADSRFADAGRRKNLPAWLRHEIRQPAPFRDVAAHLRSFIDEHHGRKPAPKASEKASTAFGLSSSSRPSAKPVVKTEDAFDSLKKLQRQVRKAPPSVQDPRVSAFLAKRAKIEQPPKATLRREAPLVERKPSLPKKKALPVVKRAPVAFPATSSSTRVKDAVAAFPSRGKAESVAAQLMRESEPLRDPDISDADASTAIKRLARIPASLEALRESKAGRRLATYVRRVECPAAARLLERWKALATPREDDGYEDVASAEAGARAEERARRHLDDYLGRAPVPAAPAPPPKPSRPPPAGVGTSKRARMLLSYTNV
jgi:regulator of telomere elongation helicase 1